MFLNVKNQFADAGIIRIFTKNPLSEKHTLLGFKLLQITHKVALMFKNGAKMHINKNVKIMLLNSPPNFIRQ